MSSPDAALKHDWLALCRRATAGVRAVLQQTPASSERVTEVGGLGEGGDRTLVIDAEAEQCVFDELEELAAAGVRFTAVSEERGVVSFGSDELLVIIDPIDGSLNAKRRITHHALSIAVASGPTMADVVFAYVFDFGTDDEWRAELGGGGFLNDEPIVASAERRSGDGRLEIVAIEAAWPLLMKAAADDLERVAFRIRALGTIAVSMCQVANGNVDGMVSLRGCRSIDAAAAQLIIRETGGLVQFGHDASDPLSAPLDLVAHGPVICALTTQGLAEVATLPVE
ncbi:MAG TPA: inositol monophosphatase family protein [Baekduia sp.]|nr:inositol monophosphatase family protein [Baekduia sp.]